MKYLFTHNKNRSIPGYKTVFLGKNDLIESAIRTTDKDLDLLFDKGVFWTKGFQFQRDNRSWNAENVRIFGTGMSDTTIKLKSNTNTRNSVFHYIFSNSRALNNLEVKGLTFDCNWTGQARLTSARTKSGQNTKFGALSFRARKALIEDIKVINPGSARGVDDKTPSGSEVFPIILTGYKLNKSKQTDLIVRRCAVEGFRGVNGGYSTGIMINSVDPYSDPRHFVQPASIPGNWYYAVVEDCVVRDSPSGIGFGCANGQRILFRRNLVTDSYCGFNCDAVHTVKNQFVNIYQNTFVKVQRGIWVGAPGWLAAKNFINFNIQNNFIVLNKFGSHSGVFLQEGYGKIKQLNNVSLQV